MKKLIIILALSFTVLPTVIFGVGPAQAYGSEDGGGVAHSYGDAVSRAGDCDCRVSWGDGDVTHHDHDGSTTGSYVGLNVPGLTCGGGIMFQAGWCHDDEGKTYQATPEEPHVTITNNDPWVNTSVHDTVTRTVTSTHATVNGGIVSQNDLLNPPGTYCGQDLTDVGELLAGRPVIHKCHN